VIGAAQRAVHSARLPIATFDPSRPSRVWRSGTAREMRHARERASALSLRAAYAELPIHPRRRRLAAVALALWLTAALREAAGAALNS
jgi:hypothetical protein